MSAVSGPGTWIPTRWIEALPAGAHREYGDQALWKWLASAEVLVGFVLLSLLVLRAFRAPASGSDGSRGRGLLAPLSLLVLSGGSFYLVNHQVNLTGPVRMQRIQTGWGLAEEPDRGLGAARPWG